MAAHDSLIALMEETSERLIAENDERQHFHGAYLRSTKAVVKDAAEASSRTHNGRNDGAWPSPVST